MAPHVSRFSTAYVRYALAVVSALPLLATALFAVAAGTVSRDVEQTKRA